MVEPVTGLMVDDHRAIIRQIAAALQPAVGRLAPTVIIDDHLIADAAAVLRRAKRRKRFHILRRGQDIRHVALAGTALHERETGTGPPTRIIQRRVHCAPELAGIADAPLGGHAVMVFVAGFAAGRRGLLRLLENLVPLRLRERLRGVIPV